MTVYSPSYTFSPIRAISADDQITPKMNVTGGPSVSYFGGWMLTTLDRVGSVVTYSSTIQDYRP